MEAHDSTMNGVTTPVCATVKPETFQQTFGKKNRVNGLRSGFRISVSICEEEGSSVELQAQPLRMKEELFDWQTVLNQRNQLVM